MKNLIHHLDELLDDSEKEIISKEKIKHKEKFDDETVPGSPRGRDKKRRKSKR
jgi:hypothetical protein